MAGGDLFVDIGILLVEGRVPDKGSPRGIKEGPHCPQFSPAHNSHPPHVCADSNFLCERWTKLKRHMSLLSDNCVPMCIDVFLCSDCSCGQTRANATNICNVGSSNDLLLEHWTVSIVNSKSSEAGEMNRHGLLQAIRSQLYFSQLSSWCSLGKVGPVCYRLSHPQAGRSTPTFTRSPSEHHFPLSPLTDKTYIKVSLKSLPRTENVEVRCPVHQSPSLLSNTVTGAFKSVFAELGQCLLDPPARIPPLKQGFSLWRDNKTPPPSRSNKSVPKPQTPSRSSNRGLHIIQDLLDDRMQSGCKHIGKHHCEDDLDQDHSLSNHEGGKDGCCSSKNSSCDQRKHYQRDLIKNDEICNGKDTCETSECNSRTGMCGKGEELTVMTAEISRNSRNNPLKRKRDQLYHYSKKLQSDSGSDSGLRTRACCGEGNSVPRTSWTSPSEWRRRLICVNSELVDSFNRLDIRDTVPQVVTKPSTPPPQVKNVCSKSKQVPSPRPLPRLPNKSCWTDSSSSDDTEGESPSNGIPTPPPLHLVPPLPSPTPFRLSHTSSPLLGTFEESLLCGRLKPMSVVNEGFTGDIGASGKFCPKHLTLPATLSFYPPNGYSAPYMGVIKLDKKGYTVPQSGTIQVTLLNPLGTVIRMFVVSYDLTDMPPNSHTFLRQKTTSPDHNNHLRYLINLRFASSKSGRVFLHTDIRMIICRQYDVNSSMGLDMESNLQSSIVAPSNPKYSPRK